jgi:hypothetical protein
LYNPNNPKNILGRLAAKAKKGSSGTSAEGEHNIYIHVEDEQEMEHSHIGFLQQPATNKATTQESNAHKKSKFRSKLHTLSNITNTVDSHHMDCFSIPTIDDSPKAEFDHMIPHLNVSRDLESCLPGLHTESPNQTRLKNCGSNPNNTVLRDEDIDEESAYVVQEAITAALFEQDFDHEAQMFVEKDSEVNEIVNHLHLTIFVREQILPC